MAKIWTAAISAAFLLAGAQGAFASCAGDAAMSRTECLRDHGNQGECAAMYRDDLRECGHYMPIVRRPMPKPMPKPMPMPMPMNPEPPPPPHH